jgi:ABC-type uncharacterized transport system permease subunit
VKPVYSAVAAVGVGLAALIIGLQLAGFDPEISLGALWSGSFGSWDAFTSATLVRAVPLILIGLGIAIAFRGGALNIGAEGQFYAGAIAATWVGLQLGSAPRPVAITLLVIAAAVAGLLWVVVPVWLKLRFGVLEVISTLLLNFIAVSLVSLMVQGPLQEPERIYPQSEAIPEAARLPLLLSGSRLHAGLVIALLAGLILWYVFTRTLWGFQLRAVGLGPKAA